MYVFAKLLLGEDFEIEEKEAHSYQRGYWPVEDLGQLDYLKQGQWRSLCYYRTVLTF